MLRDPLLLRWLLHALRPSSSQAGLYKWIALPSVPLYGYCYWGQAYVTDWRVFVVGTLLLYLLAALCLLALNHLAEYIFRRYPEPQQALRRFGAHLLALTVVTGGATLLTLWGFDALHLFGYHYQPRTARGIIASVMVYNLLIAGLFEISLAFSQWQTNELEAEQLTHQQLQGQLDAVKQQISPHFLFNSLNSLSVLIGEDPAEAERFVDELAKVYRYLLHAHRSTQAGTQPGLTTLEAELRYLHSYAYLLCTRYGAGLEFDIAAGADALRSRSLLPLTLQTLVDNAIRHNVVAASRPLRITVDTTSAGHLRVRNTRQHRPVRVPAPQESLADLQARYQELPGAPAVLVAADEQAFTVAVPLLIV